MASWTRRGKTVKNLGKERERKKQRKVRYVKVETSMSRTCYLSQEGGNRGKVRMEPLVLLAQPRCAVFRLKLRDCDQNATMKGGAVLFWCVRLGHTRRVEGRGKGA